MSEPATVTPETTPVVARPVKPADLTGRIAVYPSADIKPVPSFMFSVPTGWVLDDAADSLAVARTGEQVGDFWINAILSHQRVPRSVDFKQAAQSTWARLRRTSPTAKVTMERLARFGTNIVYLRGVELESPNNGRVLAQLHALFFAPATDEGKTVDFFQLVATCPKDLIEQYGPAFLEIVGSFRFTIAS